MQHTLMQTAPDWWWPCLYVGAAVASIALVVVKSRHSAAVASACCRVTVFVCSLALLSSIVMIDLTQRLFGCARQY